MHCADEASAYLLDGVGVDAIDAMSTVRHLDAIDASRHRRCTVYVTS